VISAFVGAAIFLGGGSLAAQEQEKLPTYRVIVTAKTRFAGWKDSFAEFKERVKKIMPFATLVGREEAPNDTAGWERWTFELAGESKLDVTLFPRVFGDMKVSKYELAVSGTATQDPKTRIVFLASFGGRVKVKIMNRPKREGSTEEPEDRVAQLAEKMTAGQGHFRVQGEIYSHGGTLAILLDRFETVIPPKLPEEKKK